MGACRVGNYGRAKHLIEDLENIVDEAVNQLSFPLICAYDGEIMPDYIQTVLLETHPYVLMEDDLIVSKQYVVK